MDNRQEEIKIWFDKTYENRANQYLRPQEAYEVFLSLLSPIAGKSILDVACGIGRILQVADTYDLNLNGIDLSDKAIDHAAKNVPKARLLTGNAESLPFADASMDYITCIGSLERFLNLKQALHEQYRVGTSDAKYCFMVRNSQTLRWKIMKQGLGLVNKKGHQGAKNIQEWKSIFEASGFKILDIIPDQWPIKKMKKILTLGLKKINHHKIESGILPDQYAGEFIFLLSKK